MNNGNKICRLCLKICNESFANIQDKTKKLLELLFVNMNFDIREDCVNCSRCSEMLQKCFEFKLICVCTEEKLISFLESRNMKRTSLSLVYLEDVQESNPDHFIVDEICRFCMKPVTHFFALEEIIVDEDFRDMLQQFLPEVTLNSTYNPVICNNCLDFLKSSFTFLKYLQYVEEHIKAYCQSENQIGKVELNSVVQYILNKISPECVDKETIFNREQFIETYFLRLTLTKKCIKDENNIRNFQVKEIKEEIADTEIYCLKSFKKEDTGQNFIKSEEIDIKSDETIEDDNVRNLPMKELKEDISDTGIYCLESFKQEDTSQNYIKSEEIDIKSDETIKGDIERYLPIKEIKEDTEIYLDNSKNEDIGQNYIKSEEIEIKSDESIEDDIERYLPIKDTKEDISDTKNYYLESSKKDGNGQNFNETESTEGDIERYEEKPQKLQCSYCNYKSSFKGNMTRHLKCIHRISLLSCQHCFYKTHSKDCLDKHREIHDDNAKFKCPQCQQLYSKKQSLENHFLRKHDNLCDIISSKIYSCNICSYKTTLKSDLLLHVNTKHSRLEKYQCNYCLHTCFRKESLKKHISSVHLNLRQHACKVCEKRFNKKSTLDGHIVSRHSTNVDLMKTVSNAIYCCEFCTFKSVHKSKTTRHTKIHSSNKLF